MVETMHVQKNTSHRSKKTTILIVDDTVDNVTIVSGLLKDSHNVRVATNGEQALRIAQSHTPPDLILLDLIMSDMDGYEICRRLNADNDTKNIPVIFLTAKTETDDETKGFELGAVDYITKPISPRILISRVNAHLNAKLMQDYLRNQMTLFHGIIESAPNAVFLTDVKGAIVLCNSQSEKMFKYSVAEFYYKKLSQLIVSNMGTRKDGSVFPIDVSLKYLPDLNDGGNYTCVIIRDISEHKRVEDAINAAKELAEDASKMKSNFLANMSHELRTPLSAIIGYSELLKEEAQELELNQFVTYSETIHSASNYLLTLINGILDLSKIEAGKMELYLEDIDLAKMIHDVKNIVLPMMKKNNNQFVVEHEFVSKSIHADVTKIKQILFNLLSNAAKFTQNGLITLNIKNGTFEGKDCILFSVSDTGIGLTEKQIRKLFSDFTQADTETSKKYGGTGLGLSICRHFCQMMGGDVNVSSVIDEGSSFTVHLPLKSQSVQ
jgi:signal transduction histidine kinase/CheY-like chemotaxis protein